MYDSPIPRRRVTLLAMVALIGGLAASAASPANADPDIDIGIVKPSLTGVVIVEKLSAVDSTNKAVTVSCPAGKKVISAGGSILSGGGQVALDDMYPNDALTNVTATGLETDSYTGNWRVKAAATCANPIPGMQRVRTVVSSSSSSKVATATCPTGRTLLGAGASLQKGQGQAVLRSIRPQGGNVVSAATGVTVTAREIDPLEGSWSVLAYAICAVPVAGQEVHNASSSATSNSLASQATYCDSSQSATGSGAEVLDSSGAVSLIAALPVYSGSPTPRWGTVSVAAEEDATSSTWSLRSWVLCADA